MSTVLSLFAFFATVLAESHTVMFENKCLFGTPQLLIDGKVVSTGQPYTSSGQLPSAIAYLQTKNATTPGCDFNGERCTLVELNLVNPTVPGGGSSSDISLIAPHAFNVPAGFQYYGADGSCDGLGALCSKSSCPTAFFQPDDTIVQRACQVNNINLLITFCGGEKTAFSNAVPNSLRSLTSGSGGNASAKLSSSFPSTPAPSSALPPVKQPSASIAPINAVPTNAGQGIADSTAAPQASSTPSPTDPTQCRPRRRRRSFEDDLSMKRDAHMTYKRRRNTRL